MEQMNYYHMYLHSPKWYKTRERRKRIDGYKCAACGSIHNLNVHHLTYKRLGREWIRRDLITLCANCHTLLHKVMKLVKADYKAIKKARFKLLAKWKVKRKIRKLLKKEIKNRATVRALVKIVWRDLKI